MGDEWLIEALGGEGCPLCVHADRTARRSLERIVDEAVTDPGFRHRLMEGGGFCGRHTRLFVEVNREATGEATAAAILFGSVVAARRRSLETAGSSGRRGRTHLTTATRPAWACPCCEQEEVALRGAIERLVEHAAQDATWRASVVAGGWCLVHLAALATAADVDGGDLRGELLEHRLAEITALEARLTAFVHHSSADRRHLQTAAERASVADAQALLAGSRRP